MACGAVIANGAASPNTAFDNVSRMASGSCVPIVVGTSGCAANGASSGRAVRVSIAGGASNALWPALATFAPAVASASGAV
jgi:hypothetical protein